MLLVAAVGWADFSREYDSSSAQTSMTNALPSEKRLPLLVRNRSLHVAVEGADESSRVLARMLREALLEEEAFEVIEVGGDEPPVLRVRVEALGLWLALFATGSTQVQYMFMSHRRDFDPSVPLATVADVHATQELIDVVASGTIEGEATHYGPVSRPAWRRLALQTAAQNIAKTWRSCTRICAAHPEPAVVKVAIAGPAPLCFAPRLPFGAARRPRTEIPHG